MFGHLGSISGRRHFFAPTSRVKIKKKKFSRDRLINGNICRCFTNIRGYKKNQFVLLCPELTNFAETNILGFRNSREESSSKLNSDDTSFYFRKPC